MSDDEKFGQYLEKRAEQLGLPTDPAAYQDGGLAVAATAFGVDEAEFLAAMLRGADIPAWVEGANTASWYWHLQFAMHPGGIRVLVPAARLADAEKVLAEGRAARPSNPAEQRAGARLLRRILLVAGLFVLCAFVLGLLAAGASDSRRAPVIIAFVLGLLAFALACIWVSIRLGRAISLAPSAEPGAMPSEQAGERLAENPESPELRDPGQEFHQSARRLAYMLFIGPLYPLILIMVCRLLFSIRRQRKKTGLSPDLRKARRISTVVLIYLLLFCVEVMAMLGFGVFGHGLGNPPPMEGGPTNVPDWKVPGKSVVVPVSSAAEPGRAPAYF